MDKNQLKKAVDAARQISPKRKFKQSFDLIINLKDLNMKNPDNHVDIFVSLPFSRGKPVKVCAFIGPELKDSAKNVDQAILASDFAGYEGDKKKIKALACDFDYFVAQATIMPQVAKVFGKVLGTRGKMPNPKVGCVVPPNANLGNLHEKLQKTIRVMAKTSLSIKCSVGVEDMPEEELLENMSTIYNQVLHALPNEKNNIKSVIVKLTMGKPVKVGDTKAAKEAIAAEEKKEAPAPAEEAPKTE